MGAKGKREAAVDGEEEMKKTITCCLLAVVLCGCGYTTRSMISSKYRTIYITPFVNKIDVTQEAYVGRKYKIYKPHLETDITNAVTNKFLFDGNLKPVKKENADLTLKGEVLEYSKDPLRYNENDDVTEYRMNLLVNISLWDNKENKLVWEAGGFTGYVDFYTEFYPLANVTKLSDDQAINSALNDLARRIVERTVNEW